MDKDRGWHAGTRNIVAPHYSYSDSHVFDIITLYQGPSPPAVGVFVIGDI